MLTQVKDITMWYRRHECGLRLAIFFSAATCAGAFGGLLARGIIEMEGVGGLPGWAWIFILEGLLTFIVAIVAFFYMNDYPQTAKFLTETEKKEISRRLEEDRSSLADEYGTKYFMRTYLEGTDSTGRRPSNGFWTVVCTFYHPRPKSLAD